MGVGKGMAKYTGRGISLDSTLVLYCLPILLIQIVLPKWGHSSLVPRTLITWGGIEPGTHCLRMREKISVVSA